MTATAPILLTGRTRAAPPQTDAGSAPGDARDRTAQTFDVKPFFGEYRAQEEFQ